VNETTGSDGVDAVVCTVAVIGFLVVVVTGLLLARSDVGINEVFFPFKTIGGGCISGFTTGGMGVGTNGGGALF
jgi:hypothetical protein